MDNRGTLEQDTVGLGNCLGFEDLAHLDHFWRQWLSLLQEQLTEPELSFLAVIIRTEVQKRPLNHCNRFQVQSTKSARSTNTMLKEEKNQVKGLTLLDLRLAISYSNQDSVY